MNPLAQLTDLLSSDYNPDYWSDHVKIEAGQLIDRLDARAWSQLEKIYPAQTAGWRVRFADASLLSEKPRMIPLLIQMLRSPEPAVGAAIAATLLEKNYVWDPGVSLHADLRRHLATANTTESQPLKTLLAQLPA